MKSFFDKYLKPTKATIVCDWFEVSGECASMFLFKDQNEEYTRKEPLLINFPNDVSLSWIINKATSTYSKMFKINIGAIEFGVLFIEPRLTTIPTNRANIQVNNEWLYTQDWHTNFEIVVSALEIKLTNISRIDIAIDGVNGILEFVSNYIKQYDHKKRVQKVGQAKLHPFAFNDKQMIFETINLGSRSSEKFCVMYHKSKELNRHISKNYIKDFWVANGLGEKVVTEGIPKYIGLDHINRIEMRYKSGYMEHYPEFFNDMSVVQDSEKLAALFFDSTERYFDFRLKTHFDIDKCKKLELIPKNIFTKAYLVKIQIPLRDNLFGIKQGLKANTLFLLNGHADEKREEVKEGIRLVIEKHKMQEWYAKRFPLWEKMVKVNNNTGHVYDIEYMLN